MEKIIKFLKNPFSVGTVAGVAFIIALIDSILSDASSYAEIGIIGKIATIIFTISFAVLVVVTFILPIFRTILKWFK
jgi:uncharacterized membrane protein YdfJ with MMPL/SSD domain